MSGDVIVLGSHLLVPCAIDRTEMAAAFLGEVLEVIQISSVFNAENKAGYTAQDAPSMRTFHLRK